MVETTQIIFVAMEVLFCGEMVILRTLLRICGAGARVRINVQTDCHKRRRSNCTRVGSSNLHSEVRGYYNAHAFHTTWTEISQAGLHTYCETMR